MSIAPPSDRPRNGEWSPQAHGKSVHGDNVRCSPPEPRPSSSNVLHDAPGSDRTPTLSFRSPRFDDRCPSRGTLTRLPLLSPSPFGLQGFSGSFGSCIAGSHAGAFLLCSLAVLACGLGGWTGFPLARQLMPLRPFDPLSRGRKASERVSIDWVYGPGKNNRDQTDTMIPSTRLPRVPLRLAEDTRRGEVIRPICRLATLATM